MILQPYIAGTSVRRRSRPSTWRWRTPLCRTPWISLWRESCWREITPTSVRNAAKRWQFYLLFIFLQFLVIIGLHFVCKILMTFFLFSLNLIFGFGFVIVCGGFFWKSNELLVQVFLFSCYIRALLYFSGTRSSACTSRACRPHCVSIWRDSGTTGRPTEPSSLTTTSRYRHNISLCYLMCHKMFIFFFVI